MRTCIVAEIGVNHDGSIDRALRLIDAAADAGADVAKFQAFTSAKLWGDNRLKALELTRADLAVCASYCAVRGLEFLCTPFDRDWVAALVQIGVKRMKVSSGCLNRVGLLEAVRDTGLPVIISTGMSTLPEVRAALAVFGADYPITLLHCTSAYPCPLDQVNLAAMDTLAIQTDCPVGYSDHTEGITVPIAAVALGACMIEKHLTLDRTAKGPDHKASIEPAEFKRMVHAIREVEQAMGDSVKAPQPAELALRTAWGRA